MNSSFDYMKTGTDRNNRQGFYRTKKTINGRSDNANAQLQTYMYQSMAIQQDKDKRLE